MTNKKILIFFDSKENYQKQNLMLFLKNIDFKKYKINLIVNKNISLDKEIINKINIIYFKSSKNKIINKIQNLIFETRIIFKKERYDKSILFSINSLLGNNIIRNSFGEKILFIYENINLLKYEYREYFIKRHIYDFDKIILKNYQEEEMFLKHYPTLSRKTHVINNLINYKKIKVLSKKEIPEQIKKTDKTILLITELNEEKNNILNTLNMIKEIKQDFKNIKLYIIGDGIDKFAYESYIEDKELKDTIFVLGKKENVYPYIEKCKYILLNKKEELDKYLIPSLILNTIPISKCRYKDDTIDLGNNFGYVLSKNKTKQKEEILEIIKSKKIKKIKFDFENINKEKIEVIENKLI